MDSKVEGKHKSILLSPEYLDAARRVREMRESEDKLNAQHRHPSPIWIRLLEEPKPYLLVRRSPELGKQLQEAGCDYEYFYGLYSNDFSIPVRHFRQLLQAIARLQAQENEIKVDADTRCVAMHYVPSSCFVALVEALLKHGYLEEFGAIPAVIHMTLWNDFTEREMRQLRHQSDAEKLAIAFEYRRQHRAGSLQESWHMAASCQWMDEGVIAKLTDADIIEYLKPFAPVISAEEVLRNERLRKLASRPDTGFTSIVLDRTCTHYDGRLAESIGQCIKEMSTLHVLDLTSRSHEIGGRLSGNSMSYITEAIASTRSPLEKLILEGGNLKDEDVLAAVTAIASNPAISKLKLLNLVDTRLHDRTAIRAAAGSIAHVALLGSEDM